MSKFDRDPVSVASRKVHGPAFGMGTLVLVAVLAGGAGAVLGGVIMPFLRSEPPDQSQTEKIEAQQETSRALLFSMFPQTIYASVQKQGQLVSTEMSVEQYLTELEVRSSQAGLSATKSVERQGDNVEISYAFSTKANDTNRTFPQTKIKVDHPKTLVLIFSSGPLPGTIALQQSRLDGRERGAGATFVDLIRLGATPPILEDGQFLTARGVFEIKLIGSGVGAFLDGILVYPIAPQKPGPVLAFPGSSPAAAPGNIALPKRLALQSYQPAVGVLKERLILVASDAADQTCGARAIIVDTQRGTVVELPEKLQTPAVSVGNVKDALILSGFCVSEALEPSKPEAKTPSGTPQVPLVPAVPRVEVRLTARYDLKTGAVNWQRETIAVVPPPDVSMSDADTQSGSSTPWRALSETRLASPLIAGGALMSVACRPGGGVTIAVAGLPVPPDGQAAGIRFAGSGGTAVAQMRWRPGAGGYELDGAGRPNEARAILDRLRAGGDMTVSVSGSSKVVGVPGRAQIDRLLSKCGAATVATAAQLATGPPRPAVPKPQIARPPPAPAPIKAPTQVSAFKPKVVAPAKAVPPSANSSELPQATLPRPRPPEPKTNAGEKE